MDDNYLETIASFLKERKSNNVEKHDFEFGIEAGVLVARLLEKGFHIVKREETNEQE